MALKSRRTCLKVSVLATFMLLLQSVDAQYNFSEVSNWLAENIPQMGGRGVLMIWKDGKVVFSESKNHLNARQKMVGKMMARRQGKDASEVLEDFTPTTKERIASSSKWLSAALVMTFVDEGKLKLDDTIGKFLPVMTRNGKGGIKIWHCLSHLTGIKTAALKESLEEFKQIKSMDEAMRFIAEQPMEGPPGKTFHYGNTGLQIAAAICEVVGHDSFENLFQKRIAASCNMKNTDYGKGKVPLAAGGGWSTGEDYTNFLVMILQKGMFNGKRVLSENSINEMQQNRIKDATIVSSPAQALGYFGYGFGEWVNDDNGKNSTVSSPGLFGSFPWIDKKRNYAGFLLVFNLKNKGRHELYEDLKLKVDKAIDAKKA
jgi:CubicO group peptidase (beta-lactamase class C family)